MAASEETNNLISLSEAAEICGVDYDTVRKWCVAGALPYVEVGPTAIKRVYRRDAERMVRRGSVTPARPDRSDPRK